MAPEMKAQTFLFVGGHDFFSFFEQVRENLGKNGA